MIIQPETVLRDTAIALLPMVAAGAYLGGWWGALGTACTGLFVLGNLFVLGKLVRRLTAFMAGQDPQGGLAIAFLVVKFPLALGLITLLAWAFDGMSVALGMGAMVFAVLVRGFVDLMRSPPDADDSPSTADPRPVAGHSPQRS